MKKFFLLLSVILCSLAASAQTALIATLSHEGTLTTYTGPNALKDSYSAAVDGDVITLSAGSFESPTLNKRVSIRGAGMILSENPTILYSGTGKIEMNIAASDGIIFEGLYFKSKFVKFFNSSTGTYNSISDVDFIKCHLNSGLHMGMCRVRFIHSKIYGFQVRSASSTYVTIINSYVLGLIGGNVNNIFLTNCVVNNSTVTSGYGLFATFKNCIINDKDNLMRRENGFTNYCYYIGKSATYFDEQNRTNHVHVDVNPFKPDTFYELKDEYVSEWLGEDGTQVGIYGGSLPFDPTPTNPQITKFNVSGKTTADGKLSVDIEVKAN